MACRVETAALLASPPTATEEAQTKENAKAKSLRLQASMAAKKKAKAEAAAQRAGEEAWLVRDIIPPAKVVAHSLVAEPTRLHQYMQALRKPAVHVCCRCLHHVASLCAG